MLWLKKLFYEFSRVCKNSQPTYSEAKHAGMLTRQSISSRQEQCSKDGFFRKNNIVQQLL